MDKSSHYKLSFWHVENNEPKLKTINLNEQRKDWFFNNEEQVKYLLVSLFEEICWVQLEMILDDTYVDKYVESVFEGLKYIPKE